jgi:hypothetical protein
MLKSVKLDKALVEEQEVVVSGAGPTLIRPGVSRIEPVTLLYRIFWSLLIFECLLASGYLVNGWIGNPLEVIGTLIDLDRETAVGTWFSSTQLFVIGALFIGMRLLVGRKSVGRLYLMLGLGFVFLSMDETAAFHEKITGVLKRFDWAPRVAGNHGLWIPVYSLTVACLLLYFSKPIGIVVRRFPRQVGVFFGGALLMVFGGVFLELLGYYHVFDNIPEIGIALEELGEMAGESLMILGAATCYLQERRYY